MTRTSVRDRNIVDPAVLEDVLARLVGEGTLESAQADAVRRGVQGMSLGTVTPAVRTLEVPTPETPNWRDRLLEAAAYLGAGFVGASVLTLVAQRWDELTWTGRVVTLEALGLTALVAGLIVAVVVGEGHEGLMHKAQAPRRRVASVVMTLGCLLVSGGIAAALHDSSLALLTASAVAGGLLLAVEFVAPSALSELAMFGTLVAFVGATIDQVLPSPETLVEDSPYANANEYVAPVIARDYLLPLALAATGMVWAGVVSRRLTLPIVATAAGLLVAFQFLVPLAGDEGTRVIGLVSLAVAALVGIAGYLWTRLWPWLAYAILTITAFVFLLVQDSAGAPLAFLVAGLVLLGGAIAGWRWGKHEGSGSGHHGGTGSTGSTGDNRPSAVAT
jgi:hypothetical protein